MSTHKPCADLPPAVFAAFLERVVRPKGALQSCADGTLLLERAALQYRAEILKRPDAERALHTLEGAAAGIRQALDTRRAEARLGPSAKGECTRTRVMNGYSSAFANMTNQTGQAPQRKAVVSVVAEALGISRRTVERYAP